MPLAPGADRRTIGSLIDERPAHVPKPAGFLAPYRVLDLTDHRGLLAGRMGDKWSLGFLVETENQGEQNLAGHMNRLPTTDQRSRAIVQQMKLDEARHAGEAQQAGAARLDSV